MELKSFRSTTYLNRFTAPRLAQPSNFGTVSFAAISKCVAQFRGCCSTIFRSRSKKEPRPPFWAAAAPAKPPCCAPSTAWSSPPAAMYSCMGRTCANANLIALRRGMGYVIQETGLFPHFTVERNVGWCLKQKGRPREERIRRSHELLDGRRPRSSQLCAALSAPALRRPAPARGPGPRTGRRAQNPADG
jgi:hypothetical protein